MRFLRMTTNGATGRYGFLRNFCFNWGSRVGPRKEGWRELVRKEAGLRPQNPVASNCPSSNTGKGKVTRRREKDSNYNSNQHNPLAGGNPRVLKLQVECVQP